MATKKQTEPEQQTAQVAAESGFTKKQIVGSRTYARYIDLLNALLNDKKLYTHAEVEQIIKNAYSGKYQLK